MTTGFPAAAGAIAEVLYFDDDGHELLEHSTCDVTKFNSPIDTRGASWDVLGGKTPIICGGVSSADSSYDTCHVYEHPTGWRQLIGKMSVVRQHAHGIAIDERTFFIAGGFDGSARTLTTEYISLPDGARVTGPQMLAVKWGGCMAKFNDTHALSAGGKDDVDDTDKTFFFSITDNEWTTGPDMLSLVGISSACAVVHDMVLDGVSYFIMAGGLSAAGRTIKTHVWKVDMSVNASTQFWQF